MEEQKRLKNEYNALLKRYENGIFYCSKNLDKIERYFPEILRIVNGLNDIITELAEKYNYVMTNSEILKGFQEGGKINE